MIAREAGEKGRPTRNHTASVITDIAIPAAVSPEVFTSGDGDVLESRQIGDGRLLRLRFPDGESLKTAYKDCTARGLPADVRRIRHEQDNRGDV